MGRRKIKISRIENNKNRNITFNKRKFSLMKKAYELSVLCDCEIALIIINDSNVLHQYASSNILNTMIRFFLLSPYESLTNNKMIQLLENKEQWLDQKKNSHGSSEAINSSIDEVQSSLMKYQQLIELLNMNDPMETENNNYNSTNETYTSNTRANDNETDKLQSSIQHQQTAELLNINKPTANESRSYGMYEPHNYITSIEGNNSNTDEFQSLQYQQMIENELDPDKNKNYEDTQCLNQYSTITAGNYNEFDVDELLQLTEHQQNTEQSNKRKYDDAGTSHDNSYNPNLQTSESEPNHSELYEEYPILMHIQQMANKNCFDGTNTSCDNTYDSFLHTHGIETNHNEMYKECSVLMQYQQISENNDSTNYSLSSNMNVNSMYNASKNMELQPSVSSIFPTSTDPDSGNPPVYERQLVMSPSSRTSLHTPMVVQHKHEIYSTDYKNFTNLT